MNSYQKGKRWGYAVFRSQVDTYGANLGTAKSDKACSTCLKYAENGKKDKALTKEERDFYRGAAKGFQEYYNKNINN